MDNKIIERIKDANDIVDVISEFVTLRKAGVNYIGVCPFHADTHPSMSVSRAKQIYKCFVCEQGGDVINFVQEYEKKTFSEALAYLGKRVGIDYQPTDLTPEQQEHNKLIESLRVANRAAADHYHEQLQEASVYLKGRGYDLEDAAVCNTLNLFCVGFAPKGNLFKKWASSAGYAHNKLLAAGLLKQGERGSYDAFQDRLLFPFFDLHGNVVGFTGRLIEPKEGSPKYSNTGDTLLFTKGKHIYGLYQAKQAIARMGFAYLVEGQMDALSLHLVGVSNAFAGSGTAFTEEQIRTVSRFTSDIVLAYDADSAGIKASLKHAESFLRQKFNIKCVTLPDGQDPDNIAQEMKADTAKYLVNNTVDFVTYFYNVLLGSDLDVDHKEEVLNEILKLIGQIESETKRLEYCRLLEKLSDNNLEVLRKRSSSIYNQLPALPDHAQMADGIYGLDALEDVADEDEDCFLTADYDTFLKAYGESPTVYLKGVLTRTQVQELRRAHGQFCTNYAELGLTSTGQEKDFTASLVACTRAGMTVMVESESTDTEDDEEAEEQANTKRRLRCGISPADRDTFINYYVYMHCSFLAGYGADRTPFIERCAELISYCSESQRQVNMDLFKSWLGLTKSALTAILKPYLDKQKSRIAISSQRQDDLDDSLVELDPEEEIPLYVKESKEYYEMYREKNYYPRLNNEGEPVCYVFVENRQSRPVGDFYMEPLLHIYSDNKDENKRVVRINRRFYKKPLYVELPSKAFTKLSTMEDELIMLEAVNFCNGDDKQWRKIKEYMSRRYVYCTEITTYGNQQEDGMSVKEDQNFFAFSNGIYHQVNDEWLFEPVNELGIAVHNKQNYYLPAFSAIYAGSGRKNDKYEIISTLMYRDIPSAKQVTFETWASLMDQVYKINDNGKWALLFSIMCAFRSNIHSLDRLFTAPFFMGPMSSGKTQIAISIRSLFISPKVPIFNLNIGTDAAMSTLMGTFRDVPVVLDEYNNKDISDIKFQALKGIVYDGDGRQKRKGTGSKEIENDKVYAPVVICGQETPQRDDNALMSRIIVCEVPKPSGPRSREEIEMFEKLKEIEDPDKVGLSNVLLEILQLRPLVMKHFKRMKQVCYMELKDAISNVGEIDRLMKTASLFLATCKLLEEQTTLKLPFTYKEFFQIAIDKIKSQVELISKSDKLATFFKAMDVMIDTKAVLQGREFSIEEKQKLTITLSKKEKKEVVLPPATRVLYLRVSNIYSLYTKSSYNKEETTQSTIEQNLRSHPSYLGSVSGKRFDWNEVAEVPSGEFTGTNEESGDPQSKADNRVTKRLVPFGINTSCIALNYNIFRDLYDIDLERKSSQENSNNNETEAQPLPF